jgi:hypothetical protein
MPVVARKRAHAAADNTSSCSGSDGSNSEGRSSNGSSSSSSSSREGGSNKKRRRGDDGLNAESEYEIVGVMRSKYVFKTRPKPINAKGFLKKAKKQP